MGTGEEGAVELTRRTLEASRIYGALPYTPLPKLLIVSSVGLQRQSATRAYQQALEAQGWEYYVVGEEQAGEQVVTWRALQLAVNALAADQMVVVSAPADVLVTGTPHDFATHYRNVQVLCWAVWCGGVGSSPELTPRQSTYGMRTHLLLAPLFILRIHLHGRQLG
jgi:hypothetical protein